MKESERHRWIVVMRVFLKKEERREREVVNRGYLYCCPKYVAIKNEEEKKMK